MERGTARRRGCPVIESLSEFVVLKFDFPIHPGSSTGVVDGRNFSPFYGRCTVERHTEGVNY